MAALNPSVQERVEREVKAYDQGEVFARSLRLQTRFQHRDSARGRSDRPVFVPHAAPLLDAAGRPGLDEDEGLRRPGNPAPARTVRINLTAASRQRIQSGATLLADRLRLRRRSRQRNAIAKALAHEAVGQWSARSNPHRPRADFPKWLPTLRPLPAAAAHHRERASRRYRPRVLRGASPRSRLSRCESSARL